MIIRIVTPKKKENNIEEVHHMEFAMIETYYSFRFVF